MKIWFIILPTDSIRNTYLGGILKASMRFLTDELFRVTTLKVKTVIRRQNFQTKEILTYQRRSLLLNLFYLQQHFFEKILLICYLHKRVQLYTVNSIGKSHK